MSNQCGEGRHLRARWAARRRATRPVSRPTPRSEFDDKLRCHSNPTKAIPGTPVARPSRCRGLPAASRAPWADLRRGVSGPGHDHPAVGERGWTAVAGGVQHLAFELLQARQCRPVRAPEGPGRRHGGPHGQPVVALEVHLEGAVRAADRGEEAAGADVGVQASGVGGEVGDDLVAVRVAVPVGSGERHPGRELYRAGEKRVRLSSYCGHDPAALPAASSTTGRSPRRSKTWMVVSPNWPPPITATTMCSISRSLCGFDECLC